VLLLKEHTLYVAVGLAGQTMLVANIS